MKQPWGITLNCFILAVAGILSIFGAIALWVAGTAATTSVAYLTGFGVTNIASYITMGGVLLIVMALVSFALCYGLWKHSDAAWWICIFLLVMGISADVVSVAFFGYTLTGMTFITIGISLLLIIGLLHRETIAAVKPDIAYPGWALE